jgi:hypothetical protein
MLQLKKAPCKNKLNTSTAENKKSITVMRRKHAHIIAMKVQSIHIHLKCIKNERCFENWKFSHHRKLA